MLYVITGPPASGKTSWVMERAKPSDIVIDYDRLAVALAGPGADSHDHPIVVKRVTHKARYAAIGEALDRVDQADVYLIHSMPNEHNVARYRALNAEIVTCNPGRAVVEQRCRAERPTLVPVVGRWYAWHARQTAPPTTPVRDPAGTTAAAPAAAAGTTTAATTSRAW